MNQIWDHTKIKTFEGNNLKLIKEALDSYSVGAYTACICVCRNILQDLVQKICKANSIEERSLKAQIEKLVEKRIVKSTHHSLLLDLKKSLGIMLHTQQLKYLINTKPI